MTVRPIKNPNNTIERRPTVAKPATVRVYAHWPQGMIVPLKLRDDLANEIRRRMNERDVLRPVELRDIGGTVFRVQVSTHGIDRVAERTEAA